MKLKNNSILDKEPITIIVTELAYRYWRMNYLIKLEKNLKKFHNNGHKNRVPSEEELLVSNPKKLPIFI